MDLDRHIGLGSLPVVTSHNVARSTCDAAKYW